MRPQIKPGKLVRYTGDFCRYTGNLHPPINGVVLYQNQVHALIVWSDNSDAAVWVHLKNLELDPACKDQTFPHLLSEFAPLKAAAFVTENQRREDNGMRSLEECDRFQRKLER